MDIRSFSIPTEIHLGDGALGALPSLCGKRVMVVADPAMTQLGVHRARLRPGAPGGRSDDHIRRRRARSIAGDLRRGRETRRGVCAGYDRRPGWGLYP